MTLIHLLIVQNINFNIVAQSSSTAPHETEMSHPSLREQMTRHQPPITIIIIIILCYCNVCALWHRICNSSIASRPARGIERKIERRRSQISHSIPQIAKSAKIKNRPQIYSTPSLFFLPPMCRVVIHQPTFAFLTICVDAISHEVMFSCRAAQKAWRHKKRTNFCNVYI